MFFNKLILLICRSPITTGTSVVGIRFDNGVMIAADNLVSYGSLARYQDVQRVFKVNEKTIIGAGGDFADFQSLKRSIDQKMIEDTCHEDSIEMKPKSLYNWLTRVFYNRRSRFNPLWLEMVVGGLDNEGVPFLGHVDLRGRAYEDDVVATGFGKHLALPLVREQLVEGKKLTQQQASEVVSFTLSQKTKNQFLIFFLVTQMHGSFILPRLSFDAKVHSGSMHQGRKRCSRSI